MPIGISFYPFEAWGVLHGLLLVGHRTFRGFCANRPLLIAWYQSRPGMFCSVLLTYVCVSLGWVLFRASSFNAAATMFKTMFAPRDGLFVQMPKQSLVVLAVVVVMCHLLVSSGMWKKSAERLLPAPVLGAGYAAVLSLSLLLSPLAGKAFIYFQF